MSPSRTTLLAVGIASIGVAIGASGFAIAQGGAGSQMGMPAYMKGDAKPLAELGNSEGVYVEKGTFKLHIGKGDVTAAQITKMGAKEVSNGAIIFRSEGKLYIVDWKKGE